MAGFQPMRSRVGFFTDDSDDIDDWMAQRNAQLAMRDEAEAAGREAWTQGIGTGDDVDASTPHDLIRLGQEALADADASTGHDDSSPTSSERLDPAQPDGPLLQPPSGQFADFSGRERAATESRRAKALQLPPSNAVGRWVPPSIGQGTGGGPPDDLATRGLAYVEGYGSGVVPGVDRGALHAAQGFGDAARLSVRMANPVQRILGHSALEPLAPIALGFLGDLADAAHDPRKAWQNLKFTARQASEAAVPFLAPLPSTAEAARQQGRRVGMNDGEIGFNVATIPLGGKVAEGLEGAALKRSALDAAGYERQGIPPNIARYFAEPYPDDGMGSHWFSRNTKIFGAKLPPWLIDSRYNVWKPAGARRGQVYEGHFLNDFHYRGGPLPDARGKGSGWSGKKLGWQMNTPVVRFFEKMPAVTRGTLAGAGLAGFDAAQAGKDRP